MRVLNQLRDKADFLAGRSEWWSSPLPTLVITLLPNGIVLAKHIFSAVRRSPVPTHLTDRRDEGEVLF
jgi:hypothetical protein